MTSIETMRKNYDELFNKKYKTRKVQPVKHIRELTESELKSFENAKSNLKKLAEMQRKAISSKEKKDNISKANQITKSVLDLPLNLEQLENLFDLYDVEEFSNSYLARDDVKSSRHRYIKKDITDKIADIIEFEMDLTDDWDELNELSKKIKRKYDASQLSKLERVAMKLRMKMPSAHRNKTTKSKNTKVSSLVDGIAKGLARRKFKYSKSKGIY